MYPVPGVADRKQVVRPRHRTCHDPLVGHQRHQAEWLALYAPYPGETTPVVRFHPVEHRLQHHVVEQVQRQRAANLAGQTILTQQQLQVGLHVPRADHGRLIRAVNATRHARCREQTLAACLALQRGDYT